MIFPESFAEFTGPRDYLRALYGESPLVDIMDQPQGSPDFHVSKYGRLLPALVAPLLQHMSIVQPEITVICDRNARPIGNALQHLIGTLGIGHLVDSQIEYFKISGKTSLADSSRHLAPLMDSIRDTEYQRVMVVDDVMRNGRARWRLSQVCERAGIDPRVEWTTFVGTGANYSAWTDVGAVAYVPWNDREDIIGVDYSDNLQPYATDTELSRQFYDQIQLGAEDFADILQRIAKR